MMICDQTTACHKIELLSPERWEGAIEIFLAELKLLNVSVNIFLISLLYHLLTYVDTINIFESTIIKSLSN